MLFLPDNPPIYRTVAIDPGSNTLGYAILDLNLSTGEIALMGADTLVGVKMARSHPDFAETHGDRATRLHCHEEFLKALLDDCRPNAVISEAPYMGRFPQAFMALIECLGAIRRAVISYDPYMPMETVDPPTAKKAVGAPGKGGGKDIVREKVLALPTLINATGRPLTVLDEHAIDAVAVGYYKVKGFSDFYFANRKPSLWTQ